MADAARRSPGTVPGRRLRVVYLDHVAQLSGGELALLRLVRSLPDVDAHVILAEDGGLAERFRADGVSVEVLPMRRRTRDFRKGQVRPGALPLTAVMDTLAYSRLIARRLRRLRPDVVHANSLKSGIYGSLAARLARTPMVWHLRDRLAPDYLPRAAVILLRTLTFCLPTVVVSNSQTTSSTAPARRRLVVPSVVEPVAPRRTPRTGGELVIGIVGRLAPWKGQEVFLKAFATAFRKGPERAMIVGAPLFGEEEVAYAASLGELAADLGVSSRVEFRGHRDDIGEELRNLDVLVHASTTPEPFGQVIVEGMSAELPVVASRAGGPEEIITDGLDGFLYPPGDVTALAAILVRLSADPELRGRIGRAARSRADDFTPTVIAAKIRTAYEIARAS